jgi:hypothetical protein
MGCGVRISTFPRFVRRPTWSPLCSCTAGVLTTALNRRKLTKVAAAIYPCPRYTQIDFLRGTP